MQQYKVIMLINNQLAAVTATEKPGETDFRLTSLLPQLTKPNIKIYFFMLLNYGYIKGKAKIKNFDIHILLW